MDDKKTWIAVLVSIVFVLFYTETVLEPYLRPAKKQQQTAQSAATVAPAPPTATGAASSMAANTAATTQPIALPSTPGPDSWKPSLRQRPTTEQLAAAPTIAVSTENFEAKISSLGGRFLSFKLKGYKLHQTGEEFVDLVSTNTQGIYPGGLYIADLDDSFVQYAIEGGGSTSAVVVNRGENFSLPLVGKLNGNEIRKSFSFSGDSYLVKVAANSAGALASHPTWLEWSHFVSLESSKARLNPIGFKFLSDENKVTSIVGASAPAGVAAATPTQWVSIDEQYFLASLLTQVKGPNGITINEPYSDGSHELYARVSGAPSASEFGIYLGPKDSEILEQTGFQLYRNIDLGFFSFLAFPLLWLLRIFNILVQNYGLAIVLLTLAIKSAFLPLTMVSFRSARAMQDLQPEMKALRERITDPTQLNQEMLGLYKKRGVNPMGGCFPMLIQIPVFLGLYNALLQSIDLRHAPFALWIKDLSAPEQLMILGFPVQLMVLILGGSMFVQQALTPTPGMEPMQRKMLLMMPIVLTLSFLIYPLPAGLVLYWIVNNTISITQQVCARGDRNFSPYLATMIAGAGFLVFGYLLTLI